MIARETIDAADSLRILHVDDDSSILEVSKQILLTEGNFEVDFASSVEEAFKKLQSQQYDVVVSDYEMPHKSGLDFLKELKEQKNLTPFILFTGKGREEVAVEALNLGADGYYNKQGNPETVYGELAHGIRLAVTASKTKLALKESQEKFKRIFDESPAGITVFNLAKKKIVDCNQSFERLTGYTREEILEKETLAVNGWKHPAEQEELISKILREGRAQKKGLEIVSKSGAIKLVDASFTTIDINGEPHSISNLIDVTKSKATEDALNETQTLMNSIVNSTEDMIWSVNADDFALLTFNRAVSNYFLKTQNLQIKAGMTSEEIMPTEQLAQRWDQLNERALKEGSFTIEYTTSIEPRVLELTFNVMKHGEKTFGIAVFARDITQRKKAEAALLESETKYRELADRLPEMVFEIDGHANVVFANSRAYELTGYLEDDFASGFNANRFVAPEDLERSKENMRRMFAGNMRQSNEYMFVKKDGTRFPVQLTSAPIVKEGKIVGARGIALDITERKKAEVELEEKYYALDRVTENIGAGLAIIDKGYRVVWANSPLRNVGFTPNKKCHEVSNSSAVCADCGVKKVFEQNVPIDVHEYKSVNSKGEVTWVELRATSLKDKKGNITAAIELVVPITERKKAQAKLMESEEKFRTLADESPNMIFINQKGKVVYANKKCEEIMGYTREEFCAPDFKFMSIVAPESVEILKTAFARHQRSEDILPYEYRLVTKDGRKIESEINTKLINYEGEKAILGVVTDITELKKNESLLKSSQAKLEAIISNAPVGIATSDPNAKFLSANKTFCKILGYTENELKKLTYKTITHADDVSKSDELMKKLVSGVIPYFSQQKRYITKNGKIIVGKITVSAVRGEDGKPEVFICELEDITAQKRAEDALRSSEVQFRSLFNNSLDAAMLTKPDGTILSANPAAERMLGMSEEEIQRAGRNGVVVVDERLKSAVKERERTGKMKAELTFRREDGSTFEGEVTSSIFRDAEGTSKTSMIVRDITERKKAEEKLQSTKNYYETLLNSTLSGIIVVDCETRQILDVNPAALNIIGARKEEVTGKVCHNFICPNEVGKCPVMDLNRTVEKAEKVLIKANGQRHPVIKSVAKINHNGKDLLIESFEDISVLKKKEEELEESHRKLQLINEKLRVVGGLTRHDVKNKLMVANSNLYVLKKKIGNQPGVAKYIEGIEAAIKQSDELFEFSRLYEQIGIEKPTEIDVADCFDQAAKLIVDSDLKIINECQGLTVTAGPMLRQLFYNLIDNSVKHGKTVTEIRLHYTKDPAGTELFYEDNGVGIPEADKKKIFAEGFTTGNGSGLGLKLVKKMIEAYGWTIKEVGTPGKGAIFQITIPAEKADGKDENMFVVPALENKLINKTS